MTWQGWLQILIYVAVLTALTPLLGGYMARVYMGRRVVLERALGPVERLFYRAVRTNPAREQDWKQYGTTVLVFSALFWPPSLPLRRRLVALALAGLGLPALQHLEDQRPRQYRRAGRVPACRRHGQHARRPGRAPPPPGRARSLRGGGAGAAGRLPARDVGSDHEPAPAPQVHLQSGRSRRVRPPGRPVAGAGGGRLAAARPR